MRTFARGWRAVVTAAVVLGSASPAAAWGISPPKINPPKINPPKINPPKINPPNLGGAVGNLGGQISNGAQNLGGQISNGAQNLGGQLAQAGKQLDPSKEWKEAQARAMKDLRRISPDAMLAETRKSVERRIDKELASNKVKFDKKTGQLDLRDTDIGRSVGGWAEKFAQGNEGRGELEEFSYNVLSHRLVVRVMVRHKQSWGRPIPGMGKVDLYSVTQRARFTYNFQNNSGDFDIDFGSWAPRITSKSVEKVSQGNLLEAAEALAPDALGRLAGIERINEYEKRLGELRRQYGADNVYLASKGFVDWATPETIGKYVVNGIVTGGAAAAQQIMRDVQERARAEAPPLGMWLQRKGLRQVEAVAAGLLTGQPPPGQFIKFEIIPIRYSAREKNLNTPWRHVNHWAFLIVWQGGNQALPPAVNNLGSNIPVKPPVFVPPNGRPPLNPPGRPMVFVPPKPPVFVPPKPPVPPNPFARQNPPGFNPAGLFGLPKPGAPAFPVANGGKPLAPPPGLNVIAPPGGPSGFKPLKPVVKPLPQPTLPKPPALGSLTITNQYGGTLNNRVVLKVRISNDNGKTWSTWDERTVAFGQSARFDGRRFEGWLNYTNTGPGQQPQRVSFAQINGPDGPLANLLAPGDKKYPYKLVRAAPAPQKPQPQTASAARVPVQVPRLPQAATWEPQTGNYFDKSGKWLGNADLSPWVVKPGPKPPPGPTGWDQVRVVAKVAFDTVRDKGIDAVKEKLAKLVPGVNVAHTAAAFMYNTVLGANRELGQATLKQNPGAKLLLDDPSTSGVYSTALDRAVNGKTVWKDRNGVWYQANGANYKPTTKYVQLIRPIKDGGNGQPGIRIEPGNDTADPAAAKKAREAALLKAVRAQTVDYIQSKGKDVVKEETEKLVPWSKVAYEAHEGLNKTIDEWAKRKQQQNKPKPR